MSGKQQTLPAARWQGAGRHLLRLVLALAGGYWLSTMLVAWLALGLTFLGLARSEAVVLSAMLGFLFYLGALLWAYAEDSWQRLMVVLAVLPAFLYSAAALYPSFRGVSPG